MELRKIKTLNNLNKEVLYSSSSGCVIINNNKVLLAKAIGEELDKFPVGTVFDTENLHETALREFAEETGCKANIIIQEPLIYYLNLDSKMAILFHYLAEIIEGDPKASGEIEELSWFDINNLPSNAFQNVPAVINVFKHKL